jgi:hypothetical protein
VEPRKDSFDSYFGSLVAVVVDYGLVAQKLMVVTINTVTADCIVAKVVVDYTDRVATISVVDSGRDLAKLVAFAITVGTIAVDLDRLKQVQVLGRIDHSVAISLGHQVLAYLHNSTIALFSKY